MISSIVNGLTDIQPVSLSECPEILSRVSEDDKFQKLETYLNGIGFSTKSNSFLVRSKTSDEQQSLQDYTFAQEYTKLNSNEKAVVSYTVRPDNSTAADGTIAKNEDPYCWLDIGDDGDIKITKKSFLLKIQALVFKVMMPLTVIVIALVSKIYQLLKKENREQ